MLSHSVLLRQTYYPTGWNKNIIDMTFFLEQAGTMQKKNTYLMFAKDKHISDYGGSKDAVIGKVISGRNIIAKLKQGDTLLKIEPVIKRETLLDMSSTQDLNFKLEDG